MCGDEQDVVESKGFAAVAWPLIQGHKIAIIQKTRGNPMTNNTALVALGLASTLALSPYAIKPTNGRIAPAVP